MADVLLTYDVYRNHEAIKKALIKDGWKDSIDGLTIDANHNPIKCHLPNTTLWHNKKSITDAKSEFDAIAGGILNIERCMCYEFSNWLGSKGDPHKDDKK